MKATVIVILLLTGALLMSTCRKINYYTDDPVLFEGSKILAHRGGGNATYRENTLESCINALPGNDGIEVDIQMSKDHTIWLSHASDVVFCGGETKCFVGVTDAEIESITTCDTADISYTKLEEVMQYMYENNIYKYISIDMKGWVPCNAGTLDIEGLMRLETEQVIALGEKYGLTSYLLFENQLASVLNWAKSKNSNVQTFIYSYGNFEKQMLVALDNDLDGISYKSNFGDLLDNDKMYLLHKKGLKVMAWNIPDSASQAYLVSIQVDLLQVDLKP